MRVNGYLCDGCRVFTVGRQGDQRDTGPFLPADWWGSAIGGPCFCPDCAARIKRGDLGKATS